MDDPRHFWLTNEKGRTEFQNALSSLFLSMTFKSQEIWWVSPWSTEFDALDNSRGDWSAVEAGWGKRNVRFSELAIKLLETGSKIRMVTRNHKGTLAFAEKLRQATAKRSGAFQHVVRDDTLHIKGLLTEDFWLAGSINFTYLGTQKNHEHVVLSQDKATMVDARRRFIDAYGDWEKL